MQEFNESTTTIIARLEDLYKDCMEMSQLKSDFDIDKFTTKLEGNFVAHEYHMLMRQYSVTLGEALRIITDITRNQRAIERLTVNQEGDWDLDVLDKKTSIYDASLSLKNRLMMINGFERQRQELIKRNGGVAPTAEQYQLEEPYYWQWRLSKHALRQIKERATGIKEGVIEAIDWCEAKSDINPDFSIKVLPVDDKGCLEFGKLEQQVATLLLEGDTVSKKCREAAASYKQITNSSSVDSFIETLTGFTGGAAFLGTTNHKMLEKEKENEKLSG